MRNFLKSKKGLALLATMIAAVATAVGAYAYFTSTGTGSGTGAVGTSTAWAVATSAYTGGPLTPGGPTESIAFTVTNPSTGQQNLANVAIKVANADGTTWVPTGANAGCSAVDFSIDGSAAGVTHNDTTLNGNKAPGAVSNGTITLAMVDSLGNQDNCKNAVVPLYLSAT
jgi:hypothetical protein